MQRLTQVDSVIEMDGFTGTARFKLRAPQYLINAIFEGATRVALARVADFRVILAGASLAPRRGTDAHPAGKGNGDLRFVETDAFGTEANVHGLEEMRETLSRSEGRIINQK